MRDYFDECPLCGRQLYVSGLMRFSGVLLEEDGFYPGDSDDQSTEEEEVTCSNCLFCAPLSDMDCYTHTLFWLRRTWFRQLRGFRKPRRYPHSLISRFYMVKAERWGYKVVDHTNEMNQRHLFRWMRAHINPCDKVFVYKALGSEATYTGRQILRHIAREGR